MMPATLREDDMTVFGLGSRMIFGFALACVAALPSRAAAPLTPLDVALGDVSLNKVSFLIAADAGIYARNGLEVHQFITPGAAQVARNSGVVVPAEYVKADIGNAPISIGGGSPMIYRVANDARSIHRIVLMTTESIIRDHIIASPSVKSVQELKGKRLGFSVPGAVTHVGAMGFAKKMGWEPGKDIMLVGGGNALNPLLEGREDALLASGMLFAMASEKKLNDLIDLTQYKIPVAGSSILAEKNWLAANRDTAARFVKAAIEADAMVKTNRAAFDAALVKWFNIKDKPTQNVMYREALEIPKKPYPAVEGIKATLAMYDSPAMRKYKAEDFYDASFITELDKSGAIDRLYK
jgi:NitT/TauT family transport system substrate-binding protein